jgi:hypothetical protein
MPFGKYRDRPMSEIPLDYLGWVLHECRGLRPWLRAAVQAEFDRRVNREPEWEGDYDPEPTRHPPPADWPELLRRWHRKLCLRYHPDRGGTHEQMLVVQDARQTLQDLLEASR